MANDKIWSGVFAGATAVLMLGILLLRSTVPPTWALLAFPAIGAFLAHVASRTTPNRRQILWLETATISAACVVLVVLLLDVLVVDLFAVAFGAGTDSGGGNRGLVTMLFLISGSSVLWWVLYRRLNRYRQALPGDALGASHVGEKISDTV